MNGCRSRSRATVSDSCILNRLTSQGEVSELVRRKNEKNQNGNGDTAVEKRWLFQWQARKKALREQETTLRGLSLKKGKKRSLLDVRTISGEGRFGEHWRKENSRSIKKLLAVNDEAGTESRADSEQRWTSRVERKIRLRKPAERDSSVRKTPADRSLGLPLENGWDTADRTVTGKKKKNETGKSTFHERPKHPKHGSKEREGKGSPEGGTGRR